MKKHKPKSKTRRSSSANTLSVYPSYTISKKKITEIYSAVSDEIMDARIAISKIVDGEIAKEIDEVMRKLNMIAPEMAIGALRRNSV